MQRFSSNSVSQQKATTGVFANEVLRKTYLLLGATLLFSGLTAYWAMAAQVPPLNPIITLIVYFGLLFAVSALRQSYWGIIAVFALTGFLGYTLGPILDMYLQTYVNGSEIVMTSLGGTGIIFFGLSAYTLISRKDFSYLGGFLVVAIMGAFLLGLANVFLQIPLLSLGVSAIFLLLCSGLILFQTSQIIHGGETSYIMATVTLFVALFNMFLSLLNILGAFAGRD